MEDIKLEKQRKSCDLDLVIGERIRIRRILMNITQSELAKSINVTFQQVQKYEKGRNRVSAVTLYNIAKKLSAPVEYFYGAGHVDSGIRLQGEFTDSGRTEPYVAETERSMESVELLKYFSKIENKETRQHILHIIQELSE